MTAALSRLFSPLFSRLVARPSLGMTVIAGLTLSGCGGVVVSGGADAAPSDDGTSSDASTDGGRRVPTNCGGIAGKSCPEGEWCSYPDGECFNDTPGVCTKRDALPCPAPLPDGSSAVCGCDHRNYGSACEARSSGQSVLRYGGCDAPPKPAVCGGSSGVKCAGTQYCDFGEGKCPAPGATGTCASKPSGCPDIYAPVCGCDGKTYGNACDARSAGMTIASTGTCTPTGKACGGFVGAICAPSEYCEWATVPSACGGDDGGGTCKPRPTACAPVDGVWCACDGKVYESQCAAAKAGQGVRKSGPCT